MKMTNRLATLLTILATTGPLLSATEVEQLRKLCAEQEMQIAQLEQKISRLTDTPLPEKAAASSLPLSQPAQPASSAATYKVKPGDSLQRIANRNDMSVAALAALNDLKPDSIIHPDQKITISTVSKGSSSPTYQSKTPAKQEVYKIQPGDTLYKISRKYGVSVNQLMNANPGIQPTTLRVGAPINVTAKTEPAPMSNKGGKESSPSLSASSSVPITNDPSPTEKKATTSGPIKINTEITYDEFARNYKTTTKRLDELNGLSLDPSTVLAQGSELYIPAQP